MKTVYKRLLPVAAATSLWIVGNLVFTPSPANGGGVEAESNPSCHSENIEFIGHQECGTPVNGQCQGSWAEGTYTISECNGPQLPNGQACDSTKPGPTTVFFDIYQGNCNFFQGFCVQGDKDPKRTLHSYKADQPSCSDGEGGVTP